MSDQNNNEINASVIEQLNPVNECIRVDKIYDWVLLETDHIQEITVPEEILPNIDDAIRNGHQLEITGSISIAEGILTSIASIIRKTVIIKGQPIEIGCAQILKTVSLTINVDDLTEGGNIASFVSSFQILERVGLCFPEPFTSDNININISNAEALSLSDVPVNGNLIFEIGICQEIQVDTQVTLKVLASFCQPRDNTISCDNSNLISCDKPSFPKQCPVIFPGR